MAKQPLSCRASRVAYSSPWMQLRVDEIVDEAGALSEYGVVIRRPYVMILACRGDELLFVRQYRYPIGAWTLELPQGAIEPTEEPKVAAARELLEETGCQVEALVPLGRLYEAAGFATHHAEVFVGDVIHQTAARPEGSEAGMSASFYPFREVRRMILEGQFIDGPSLAGLSLGLVHDPRRFRSLA